MSDADDPGSGPDAEPNDYDPVEPFDDGMDLRSGADACYNRSVCDTDCPVAEVDDGSPPKFYGPEQWRLKRTDHYSIDESIMDCSNCMRCDDACPSSVPLSRVHNSLRAQYVDEELSALSIGYWCNRLLANYGTMARLGSRVPRLTNFVFSLGVTKWVNEHVLGIAGQREFPAFATETFREWSDGRGGRSGSRERAREHRRDRGLDADVDGRVAYVHGDYAEVNTPEVAKALVRVFERHGHAVAVPERRRSGRPMFANGMLDDARRAARHNVATFRDLVEDGYDVICSCASCSMALRQEYPELFDFEGTERVATNTYEALEYLRIDEDLRGDLADAAVAGPDLVYQAPCHARN